METLLHVLLLSFSSAGANTPPLWRGPQKAGQRWRSGLGADPVEVLALRNGVLDLPKRWVAPFQLDQVRSRPFSAHKLAFAEETMQKRIARGTWRGLSEEKAAHAQFVSNEFLRTNSDGTLRSVADLKFISSHWNARATKCDTLEANATQLREGDRMLSFDVASGYHQFRLHPSMRQWFTVKFARLWFQYTALPFCWQLSGY
jgi:hypothetical protein